MAGVDRAATDEARARGTVTEGRAAPEGAILDEAQIRKLKVAIAIMSALLVIGIVTLIGRVIYLANRGDPASATAGPSSGAVGLQADVRLALPQGAHLKSSSLQGGRLIAHYAGPRGEGLVIVDLATGRQVSHVRIEPAQ